MSCDVVVAVRGGPDAKSRLASRLTADQREALVAAMLADMLDVLAVCPSVDRVYVATPTPALARIAARAGAVVVLEHRSGDLNGAFERARRRIAASEPEATVMLLPGDLPRLDAAEVEACLAAAGDGRLVLAPASADGGTGALVLRADAPLSLAFGVGSFDKHLAAAQDLDLSAEVVRAPGLGFDLDRPADIDALVAQPGGGRTVTLLQGWRAAA